VSLFGDDRTVGGQQNGGSAANPVSATTGIAEFNEPVDPQQHAKDRRRNRGWTVLIAALVLGLVMSFIPTGFVIEQPGPVFNTLGSQEHDGAERPLIEINGAPTYPTAGTLDMLTVSVLGTPDGTPSWGNIIQAFFDPRKTVVPLEAVFPSNQTTEQRNQQNAAYMSNSQQDAIAAALLNLGYQVGESVTVSAVTDGSPSVGELQSGDVIQSVNGQAVTSIDVLKDLLRANGTDKAAALTVQRGDSTASATITPQSGPDGSAVLGIGVGTTYVFPFDVTIQLDNVGGPSAGMMFALGIIDLLTPGELNGGQNVAGTGTIDADGNVGPIGGIRQKLFGARDAGASWFLAPADNCSEVVGHVPDGIRVFAVHTLAEAKTALAAISSGTGLDEVPSCDAVVAGN
jgi:PDZ domain-containing protein